MRRHPVQVASSRSAALVGGEGARIRSSALWRRDTTRLLDVSWRRLLLELPHHPLRANATGAHAAARGVAQSSSSGMVSTPAHVVARPGRPTLRPDSGQTAGHLARDTRARVSAVGHMPPRDSCSGTLVAGAGRGGGRPCRQLTDAVGVGEVRSARLAMLKKLALSKGFVRAKASRSARHADSYI